ncbi:MAG: riboflavin synthase [Candidatus Brocadiia bacterium]
MFTGIVQKVAQVKTLQNKGQTARLTLKLDAIAREIKPGDSVLVNGVCLTATTVENTVANFDISAETLRLTNLGNLSSRAKVNIELALRPTDRFGGHFVTGHVDGLGRVKHLQNHPGETRLVVQVPPELTDQMILKGSVAVDGVSLTIAALRPGEFQVSLIPHTLDKTNFSERTTGDELNIECDMVAKLVQRYVRQQQNQTSDKNKIDIDVLREEG